MTADRNEGVPDVSTPKAGWATGPWRATIPIFLLATLAILLYLAAVLWLGGMRL